MITSRKGSSGNSGMILPDSGKSSSLRKTVSECCRKLVAAEGLSRRIYARADRNWVLAVGVKRTFTMVPGIGLNQLQQEQYLYHNPRLFAISLSPLAKSRRISLSCSDFSYASTPIMTAAARPLCVMIMGSLLSRNFFRILAASCLKSLTGRIFKSFPIAYLLLYVCMYHQLLYKASVYLNMGMIWIRQRCKEYAVVS